MQLTFINEFHLLLSLQFADHRQLHHWILCIISNPPMSFLRSLKNSFSDEILLHMCSLYCLSKSVKMALSLVSVN